MASATMGAGPSGLVLTLKSRTSVGLKPYCASSSAATEPCATAFNARNRLRTWVGIADVMDSAIDVVPPRGNWPERMHERPGNTQLRYRPPRALDPPDGGCSGLASPVEYSVVRQPRPWSGRRSGWR